MKGLGKKQIRWGILGCGKIARKFAEDLARVSDCELYAVGSRTQEKAQQFAKDFAANKAFGSYEDLATCKEIDAIYIATPHCFHKENSILCLRNKKAVLCEKPFAMNLEEVAEMIAVAQQNDVLLMEALWTYFLPHYEHLLKLIHTEKYGKILSLKADFGFYTPYDLNNRVFRKEVGGGSLLDIGIYPIFAALSTLGNPDSIEAKATFFENGADSSCEVIFHYKQATALLRSTLLEATPTEAVFICENGSITLNSRFHQPSSIAIESNGTKELLEFPTNRIGYAYEIEHFNQLLREGKKESDVMSYGFSEQLIKTLDQVRALIGLTYDSL